MITGWFLFAFFIFLIDQIIKKAVEERFRLGEERKKGVILFRRVHNKGAMLNLFSKYPDQLRKVSLLLCGCIFAGSEVIWRKKGNRLKKTGLAFLTAGAFSNTVDRIVKGHVVDYIGFESKSKKIKSITYNFADFYIFFGMILLYLGGIFRKKKAVNKRGKDNE